MRSVAIVTIHEVIEPSLLLQQILHGWLGRLISNSRQSTAIFSPPRSRATNRSRSSILEHSCQGTLRSRKVQKCYPCPRNELLPSLGKGNAPFGGFRDFLSFRKTACIHAHSRLGFTYGMSLPCKEGFEIFRRPAR